MWAGPSIHPLARLVWHYKCNAQNKSLTTKQGIVFVALNATSWPINLADILCVCVCSSVLPKSASHLTHAVIMYAYNICTYIYMKGLYSIILDCNARLYKDTLKKTMKAEASLLRLNTSLKTSDCLPAGIDVLSLYAYEIR